MCVVVVVVGVGGIKSFVSSLGEKLQCRSLRLVALLKQASSTRAALAHTESPSLLRKDSVHWLFEPLGRTTEAAQT